jgi:hypothetical protein
MLLRLKGGKSYTLTWEGYWIEQLAVCIDSKKLSLFFFLFFFLGAFSSFLSLEISFSFFLSTSFFFFYLISV